MVIYVNDPDITTTISDLDVRFSGEMELRNRGLAITGRDKIPQLSVVVTGKRSDLMNFMDDVYVQVNVSDVNNEGEYNLSGAISLPTTRISVEKERYGDIPITVEPVSSKEINVSVKQTGAYKDTIVKSEATNPKVTITGAKSEVDMVKGAVAEVDVSDVTENGSKKVGYLLTDENGALIEKNETLESSRAFIEIENTLYSPKTLPVEAALSPELEKSYILKPEKSIITPATATIGTNADFTSEKLIAYINKITSDESGEYEISVPEGAYIPKENSKVKIKYEVVKKTSAQLEIDVQPINASAGLTARTENKISVRVSGEEGTLTPENVKAVVDVKDLAAGEYSLPVTFSGENISVEDSYSVNVIIE